MKVKIKLTLEEVFLLYMTISVSIELLQDRLTDQDILLHLAISEWLPVLAKSSQSKLCLPRKTTEVKISVSLTQAQAFLMFSFPGGDNDMIVRKVIQQLDKTLVNNQIAGNSQRRISQSPIIK